jgi:lantibiotic modifying enzyme
VSGFSPARDAAIRCGERLLDRAVSAGGGLGWRTRMSGDVPQIGFSHGASGVGFAMSRLAEATGDSRFAEAASGAFAFERGSFWETLQGWLADGGGPVPRGREAPLERAVAMAWCYGVPGVGLARLRALDRGEVPAWREEFEECVRLTLDRGFGRNHCLCHGDLGNLDFLLQAEERLRSRELAGRIGKIAGRILGSIERDGWLPGTRGGAEAPALMNGYAGIGYGLLRLADPARVPSVLSLDPPRGNASADA